MNRSLGRFKLGFEKVELRIRSGEGGSAALCPVNGASGRITIGIETDLWEEVYSVLLHEAMEYALHRNGCSYSPSCDFTNNPGARTFVVDHQKFDLSCRMAGEFITECYSLLLLAWKKHTKQVQSRTLR
ncbi:hypothetical protein TSACC_21695 [Terrimicrobium sacchariphilum]|uniref:Uncharacterized protein n=1 Tax=Terrimicrobium sacchariphilum TaxID=690879 RepID=A0A146G7E3_TERSA|nr:hypothetical protein [Terrimicrobium sacchariphilum]GAT33282.1 hypothetical protein TSACC_21695 [Terrimicrobium sacchariphilum]